LKNKINEERDKKMSNKKIRTKIGNKMKFKRAK
jgi:hypothetical protein